MWLAKALMKNPEKMRVFLYFPMVACYGFGLTY